MQLNVKIDDEIYKVAKQTAKAKDMRLRHWIERAILSEARPIRMPFKFHEQVVGSEHGKMIAHLREQHLRAVKDNEPSSMIRKGWEINEPWYSVGTETRRLLTDEEIAEITKPVHPADGATVGEDDCTPPPEAHVKARGKKKTRGGKPVAAKESSGGVRPKIDISRLLP